MTLQVTAGGVTNTIAARWTLCLNSIHVVQIIPRLLFVLTFSLRMKKKTNAVTTEQVSPQSLSHCLYSVQYVDSSDVHSVNNQPDNNGETGEYFCIYCTFVTKKSRILFALI